MTQTARPSTGASGNTLLSTPWPDSAGLIADAIDTAAAMIVIEVLLDALVRIPDGRAALDDARHRRIDLRSSPEIVVSPLDAAAAALALALIEAADDLDEESSLAA